LKKTLALGLALLIGFACQTPQPARHKPEPVREQASRLEARPEIPAAPAEGAPGASPPFPPAMGEPSTAHVPGLLPTHFNSKDASVMVLVPVGKYAVGVHPAGQQADEEDRKALFAFYIDRNEITVRQFLRYQPDYVPPRAPGEDACPECPATGIDWFQASRYCLWANKRLPREAEWEAAARGTGQRRWPWGDAFIAERGNFAAGSGPSRLRPVGSFPAGASPFGALDMAGNAWEWVRSPLGGAIRSETGERLQVAKGGGYTSAGEVVDISFRNPAPSNMKHPAFGFRCAKAPPSTAR